MQTNRPKGVAREAQRYELTGVPTSTWYDLQNAGLAPTRNPAARYSGGAHSACSLVAEELKKMGVRRCNEDAVQKIYKKFKKGLPDTAQLDGLPDNLLESFSKNFPSEK